MRNSGKAIIFSISSVFSLITLPVIADIAAEISSLSTRATARPPALHNADASKNSTKLFLLLIYLTFFSLKFDSIFTFFAAGVNTAASTTDAPQNNTKRAA